MESQTGHVEDTYFARGMNGDSSLRTHALTHSRPHELGVRLRVTKATAGFGRVSIGAVKAPGLTRRKTLDHDRSIRGSKSAEIVDVDGENQATAGLDGGGNDVRIGKIF